MSLLIMIIPVIFVALIVVIIAGIKSEREKGGEDVLKNVYIYLVLFATLMMTIGGSVASFMAVADIIVPSPYYQSFEEYSHFSQEKPYPETKVPGEKKLSEAELREQYEAMVSAENERQVNRAKNTLIKSFGWILVPFPIFLYFQRRLSKKEI